VRSRAARDVGRRYRIERPTLAVIARDLRIARHDPGPGDPVPRFDLPTTDGGRFTSESIAVDGRPVVLVFGSLTCPVTESAASGLLELHDRYAYAVRFVVVNVREAHPGQHIRQPQTFEDKSRNAAALKAHHGFEFDVAVDDLDGNVHRAFGDRPSSAYVIDGSGMIVFRAHWSNSSASLGRAVLSLLEGRAPSPATVGQTSRAMTRMSAYAVDAFDTAGPGALRDFWRVGPPVAAMIALSRFYGFLPHRQRMLAAVTTLMVLSAAAVVTGTIALR